MICIVSTDRVGGPGKNILEFLERESCFGVQTHVATFVRRGETTNDFVDALRKRGRPVTLLYEAFRFDPRPIRDVARLFRRTGAHIIQSHGPKANTICFALSMLNIPFKWIAFFHGRTYQNIKIRAYNALDNVLLRFPDHVVAVTRTIVPEFRRFGIPPSRISVIPNAVDPALYVRTGDVQELRRNFGASKDDTLVGVFGRLSPEKGQREFVQAMTRVVSRRSDVKAILAGEGQLEEELTAMIRDRRLENHVRLLGHRADVPELLSALDVLVLPSWSEAMPNAILEAMASDTPIVSTIVGEVPYMVTHGRSALLVPPRNPDALADAVIEMVSNPKKAQALAQRARRDVVRYHPDVRAERIADLYRRLLRNP
ncbi:MAG: glycosyltransferase family 4 protein [Planctomycetes bacterium]|nr:glycosyltransferase family 4 protein [Planctomycetota bacterium]